jgi:hypothetical protein
MRTGKLFGRTVSTLTGLAVALIAGSFTGAVVHSAPAHAASAMAGQITRAEVLARANNWYSRNPIAYDESGATKLTDVDGTGHYRPDCSGFVSMAWHASDSGGGYNTQSLPNVSHAIDKADLEPGDALVIYATISGKLHHHAVLFEAWQPDHQHFSYYSLGGDNVKHATGVADQWDNPNPLGDINGSTLDSHPLSSYIAYRYNKIEDGVSPQLADLNHDGRTELVARDASGSLLAYPHADSTSLTPSTWGAPVEIGTGFDTYDLVTLADLNNDGLPEIIARAPGLDGGTLLVYPHVAGVTDIASSSWGSPVAIGTGYDVYDKIVFADLNKDGLPEIVTRKPGSGNGALIGYPHVAGVTAIAASSWSTPVQIGTGWNIYSQITLGDLDNDGLPELVAINANNTQLMAYPHKAGVTAIAGTSWSAAVKVGSGWNVFDTFGVSDLNSDGLPELVVRKPSQNSGSLIAYPHKPGVTSILGTSWTTPVEIGSGWNQYT